MSTPLIQKMKRAFTLIELLVVIAIIAILAAILFPVFAQAKASAKQTSDIAQCRQIGTAFQLYLSDFDDVYPPLVVSGPNGQTQPNNFGLFRWPWLIQPYVKSFQLFWSPVETDKQYQNMSANHPFNGYAFGLTPSWGYNQRSFSPESVTGYSPISSSGVAESSNTLLLASSIWWTAPTDPKTGYFRVYPPAEWAGSNPLSGLSYGHVWPRHRGTHASVLFADTHLKAKHIQAILTEDIWRAER